MDELTVRLIVVAGIGLGAYVVGRLARRLVPVPHPPIDPEGLPVGIVVFTSTTCTKCKEALAIAGAAAARADAPIREVTFELEPQLQTRAGVESVPLTAVIAADQSVVAQFTGVPRPARLDRALRR